MEQQIKSSAAEDAPDYWYDHRHDLNPGQVFRTRSGEIVQLDRGVPGDGTKWYVLDWCGYWSAEDNTIEPGDLRGLPIENTEAAIKLALGAAS